MTAEGTSRLPAGVIAFSALFGARSRTLLQYRAAAAAGFGTQLFWGLIRVMIFDAFYRSSNAPQPMSLAMVVSYVWLGQAMLCMLPWSIDTDIRTMVRSGTVAYELLRPIDLYALWYSRALAMRSAPTVLRALPMILVAGLFFGLRPPPTWECAILWVAATLGALVLASAITTLVTISLLWTVSGEGVTRLLPTLATIFSGMFIPIPLFPDWMQNAFYALPFRGLVDTPFRIYLGHLAGGAALSALAQQWLWTGALVLFGRWLLGRGVRAMVVQGG